MTFMEDPSQPVDTPNRQWSEAYYDGKPDSWCPVIGVHWHKHHDEHLKVIQGKITFFINGESKVCTPEDEELFVPRLTRHGFKFHPGVETRLRERTNPVNAGKQDFFEDLLEDGSPTFLTAMRSFYNGDCYPAFPGGFGSLEVAFVNVVGGFAHWWRPRKGETDEKSGGL